MSADPAFRLGQPATNRTLAFTATLPTEALTERHRPATLADVVGQGAVVYQLESFLAAPVPQAFLFAGPTGTGKTTVARALANDLGVSMDWGFTFIRSAEADGQAVDDALRTLRHTCPAGSGWKVCLVDEADLMSPKASHLWLSALENLPPKSIVVFTTNAPDRFPDRFLDRTERLDFQSAGDLLTQDAQVLADRIWLAETGRTDSPRVADLPNAIDTHGRISFRRVVAALDPRIRALAAATIATAQSVPVAPPALPVAVVATMPDPTPEVPPVAALAPDTVPPAKRPRTVRPAPTTGPDVIPFGPTDARKRIDARLAAIEDEYDRLGQILLELDEEKASLKRDQKRLAKRSK